MRIFVCIKQVPDTETRIKINADKTGIDGGGVKWVVNPYDEYAIEEAVKIKEASGGGQVSIISVGPKVRVINSIRTAMAMGADDGIVVDAPENIDLLTTAKAIAEVIKKETGNGANQESGYDAIFTGKLAIDDSASAVSQMVAELLAIPHIVNVNKLDKTANGWLAEREIEGGAKEIFAVLGPVVVGANKGLNKPRFASLPGIMKAKAKPLKEMSLTDLGLSDDSLKTKYIDFQMPADRTQVKIIAGDVDQQAKELARLLKDEAKVL